MSARSARYRLAPQMAAYDRLPLVLAPYVTMISKPNFRSAVVNTDARGFRVSQGRDGPIDSESWWRAPRRALVLGGSFVFGVGATHDRYTAASALNAATEWTWLNLGLRAGNSTQELIAAIPFVSSAECVVVCSGMNTLVAGLQSIRRNDLFGPLFAEEHLSELASWPVEELPRLVRGSWQSVSLRLLLEALRMRVWGARSRRNERRAEGAHDGRTDESIRQTLGEALNRQRRDLAILRKAVAPWTTLLFAAQPFAGRVRKTLTEEEQRLFEITDGLQERHWQVVKRWLVEQWPVYVAALQAMCEQEGIRFLDLNAVPLDGWCFVDRVHMTDLGYAQVADRLAEELGGGRRVMGCSDARGQDTPEPTAAREDPEAERRRNLYPLW